MVSTHFSQNTCSLQRELEPPVEEPGGLRLNLVIHASVTHPVTEVNRESPGRMRREEEPPPEAGDRDLIRRTRQTNPKPGPRQPRQPVAFRSVEVTDSGEDGRGTKTRAGRRPRGPQRPRTGVAAAHAEPVFVTGHATPSSGRFTPVQSVTQGGSGHNGPRHFLLKRLCVFQLV